MVFIVCFVSKVTEHFQNYCHVTGLQVTDGPLLYY